IALVLMAAIAIAGLVGDPMDGGMIAIGAVIIGAAFGLFMYLLLGHRVRTWNHKLQHRSEGLPPAGTAIFLDAKGLSVGSDIFAWPSPCCRTACCWSTMRGASCGVSCYS